MSTRDEEVVLRLAEAVGAGTPVDWEREGSTHAGLGPQLRQLRVLEAMMALFSGAPPDPRHGDPASFRTSDSTESLGRGLAPGQILGGRYEVRAFLGEGGMGEVWLALDLRLRVDVALKSVRRERLEDPQAIDALRHEVRAARQVTSPYVCRIFDFVEADGQEFVSMEYVDGTTLAKVLRARGPLELREAAEVASQFLVGLDAIHEAGLVHRDIKPGNVMITRTGRVVLMDFGLAKPVSEGRDRLIVGTRPYMAPEQLEGRSVDARTDIFAAGLVLAEAISAGGSGGQMTRQALWDGARDEPPRLPDGPWRVVLLRAIARDPTSRYPSARELARALEEVTLHARGADDRHPYPGLASFTEADAALFFGREAEVEQMWRRLRWPHLQAIIGPSGAGKSSFLRAGLVPTLPDGWRCVVCTPGGSPMMSLAQALASELSGDIEAVRLLPRFEDSDVVVRLIGQWRKSHEQALLIVDQFEELFTLNPREVQVRFAELLGRLALEADVHVLLSMRDDFLFHCHSISHLAPIFSELTPLGSPTGPALRRALTQPAVECGYRFEDDALVEEMLAEVKDERGALPLLAFAIARLWEKRNRETGLLTREAYRENGGVGGALAQHAEATLDRIGPAQQPIVREIFRNLVTAQGTRAVRDRDELLSVFPDPEPAERVLRALVDARLLISFEVREGDGEETVSRQRVEIIHESLLVAWPRLVRWRTQDADGAQLRDQLRQAARLWEEKGRPADLLWTGTAYQELKLWRERYPGSLTALEETFARSMADRVRRKRRLMRLALASAFLLITVIGVVIGISRHQAARARDQARSEALRAEASKLLALAELRLADDPTEALAFTVASLEQLDTDEARIFAMKALWEAPPAFELMAGSQAARMTSFSPDGKWLAASGHAPDVLVWSEDGRGPLELPGHETSPRDSNVAEWASTDLLVTGMGGTAGSGVRLWSLPAGKVVRTINFGGPSSWQVGQGRLLAATIEAGRSAHPGAGVLRSWTLPDGEPAVLGLVERPKLKASMSLFGPEGRSWLYARDRSIFSRPLPVGTGPDRLFARLNAEIEWIRFWEGPDRLVAAESSGQTEIWRFLSQGPGGRRSIQKPETASHGMLPEPSLRWLSEIRDNQVRLWDVEGWPSARPTALRSNGRWYGARDSFHPTGDWIVASTAAFHRLNFWPLRKRYPSVVDGYASIVRPVAFSPDGKWLATSWSDLRLRLWPMPGSGLSEVRLHELPGASDPLTAIAFDPRGRYVFVVGNQNKAWVVPLDGSPPRKLPESSQDTFLTAAAVSPNGRLVATAFWYGRGEKTLRVWNLQTGQLERLNLPEGGGSPTDGNEAGPASTGYERGITRMTFTDESTLYTTGDGGLRRWNLEARSQELLATTLPQYGSRGAFSADGRFVLTVENQLGQSENCPGAFLHDLTTGSVRRVTGFGECGMWNFRAFALDPSGTVMATGSRDGIVRVGRLSGGEPHLLVGHKGAVDGIAISPDLRWVATSGEDNTLRLWAMPNLSNPPLHTLPHDVLLAKLQSLTNVRVVRDSSSPSGWKPVLGPFPGWRTVPTW